mgnify:FL=1
MRIQPVKPLVVAFHTNNGMMPPEIWTWNEKANGGKGAQELNKVAVINERTGEMGQLPPSRQSYLIDKPGVKPGQVPDAREEIRKINKDSWLAPLSQITQELGKAKEYLGAIDDEKINKKLNTSINEGGALSLFETYKNKPEEFKKTMALAKEAFPQEGVTGEKAINRQIEFITHGDIMIRDAFHKFKEQYDSAKEVLERKKNDSRLSSKEKEIIESDNKKLAEIKSMITDKIDPKEEYLKDYRQLGEFADILTKGVEKLSSLQEGAPERYRPLKDFAIEQASKTFSNLAMSAYNEVNGDINRAPIIAIENTPAQSQSMGISRAEDMKELIEVSQRKFADNLIEKGMSESKAMKTAEQMIGVTWDVGHLNMLRKFGYGDKQLIEQTKTIAKHVKKLHLSDNFGFEHTELPMGMGNVPMKEHLDKLREQFGEKMKDIKQVLETAQWHEHFKSPSALSEVMSAYGSQVFNNEPGLLWNQTYSSQGGYFAGLGYNPDVHHSMYGGGFSGLPAELGGQIPGMKRSGFSGTPMD